MSELLNLLADATQQTATTQPTGGGSIFQNPLIPLVLMIGVFWFIMSRSRGKERKKFEDMLSSMERNDRIQTIGGIIGTVVEVRENEVVVKVDENSNTKMRFNRGAIKEVIKSGGSSES